MDEIKELLELVKALPNATLFVLAGYLVYKLVQIGSIYGIIRLVVVKVHDYFTTPVEYRFNGKTMSQDVTNLLNAQLARLLGSYNYFGENSVRDLEKAIDQVLRNKTN
jgi:hypothetical protein